MKFLKKLFGIKPKVGDQVEGYLDFNVTYKGKIVCTNIYHEVEGTTTIHTMEGNIKERGKFYVPIHSAKHA